MSLYPRELTEIYNHPEANQYDLSSVNVLMALGTNIMPVYEKWIIESMPNLTNLFNVGIQKMTIYLELKLNPFHLGF